MGEQLNVDALQNREKHFVRSLIISVGILEMSKAHDLRSIPAPPMLEAVMVITGKLGLLSSYAAGLSICSIVWPSMYCSGMIYALSLFAGSCHIMH
jgi:hydrogenase/urease accessory protein HupE